MGEGWWIDLRQCVAAIRRLCRPLRGQASLLRVCAVHEVTAHNNPVGARLAREGVLSYADESKVTPCY